MADAPVPVTVLAETPSTSLAAKDWLAAGGIPPRWFRAERQTSGYGRRGRAWSHDPANLAASLLLPLDRPLPEMALLSFAAALAIADAFIEAGAAPQVVRVKWPNDVLLAGAKASGLLLETASGPAGQGFITGIGVNLKSAPEGTEFPASALADHVANVPSPAEFLTCLDRHYTRWRSALFTGGFATLRPVWLDRAARLGETVEVRLPHETLSGLFETVDEEGALVLRQPGGSRKITSGDVFF